MEVIFIMIPVALLLGAAALVGFLLSTRSGQYDDLDTPPMRAVFDDED